MFIGGIEENVWVNALGTRRGGDEMGCQTLWMDVIDIYTFLHIAHVCCIGWLRVCSMDISGADGMFGFRMSKFPFYGRQ